MISDFSNAATLLQDLWQWQRLLVALETKSLPQSTLLSKYVNLTDTVSPRAGQQSAIISRLQFLSGGATQQLAQVLQKGRLPSLRALIYSFPSNATIHEIKHMLVRYSFFLNQSGEVGKLRAEQLNTLIQYQSKKDMLEHLERVRDKFESESREARDLQTCIGYLESTIEEMNRVIHDLLEKDPSHGQSIQLKQKDSKPMSLLTAWAKWFRTLPGKTLICFLHVKCALFPKKSAG